MSISGWLSKNLIRPTYFLGGLIQVCGLLAIGWTALEGVSWQWWVSAAVMYFMYYCVGMSVGLHRYYSHNAFKARPWAQWVMLLCSVLGGQSTPVAWVHQHRLHHQGSDGEKDPHWFQEHGWKMLFIWGYPRYDFTGWELRKYFRDKKLLFLHKHHNPILLCWIVLLYALGGLYGVVFFWLIPAALSTTASLALVTVTHNGGLGSYRNFKTKDQSYNVFWLGYLTFGEGWHNNHHHRAGSINLGKLWW